MERALLVGACLEDGQDFQLSMEELASLAEACQMEVVGQVEQNLAFVNKTFYIGTGKVEEVKDRAWETDADIVIFNNALTPTQMRNLQKELELPIYDRSALILDIFSSRAKSREARLQVEVAKLQYMLPRLVGLHDALSRQGGGSSLSNKGAGEKKLELDRRKLERRLTELKRELKEVSRERLVQRKRRMSSGLPRVALVGYTNAGKSTLMNAMLEKYGTEADTLEEKKVLEQDMLFATLDTTVRKISPDNYNEILLSDTVGFINQLPHHLIEAFHSTLEEARESDVLIQVVDYSDPHFREQIAITNETLRELHAETIPMIYVYNKSDKIDILRELPVIKNDAIYLSAKEGIGLEELLALIMKKLAGNYKECVMMLPYKEGGIVSYLNENAVIKDTEYLEEGVRLTLHCKIQDYHKYAEYLI